MKSKKLRHLQTAWIESGGSDKPIMLFLHGYPDSASSWDQQIEYFQDRYQVIAPYARGTRPSQNGSSVRRYGQSALALDQLQILKEIDPTQKRPIICVGHDLGAVQAWKLAPLLGPRLAGLVIINGLSLEQMIARFRDPRQLVRSWYIFFLLLPYLPERLISKFPGRLLSLAHRLGGLSAAKRPRLSQVLGGLIHPVNQYRAYARQIPELLKPSHVTSRLKTPVLVLWGKDDPFVMAPTAPEISTMATRHEIRIIPGGHWLQREHAPMVNKLIDEFCHERNL